MCCYGQASKEVKRPLEYIRVLADPTASVLGSHVRPQVLLHAPIVPAMKLIEAFGTGRNSPVLAASKDLDSHHSCRRKQFAK